MAFAVLDFVGWKRWFIWFLVAGASIVSLSFFLPQIWQNGLGGWAQIAQMKFAVDLRGGSRLVVQFPESTQEAAVDAAVTVMRKRLKAAGVTFTDVHIERQGRDRLRIEVTDFFDVSLLKDLLTIPARISLYQLYQGITAKDVILGRAAMPEDALLFYDHGDDPPIGYLVKNQQKNPQHQIAMTAQVASHRAYQGDIVLDILQPWPVDLIQNQNQQEEEPVYLVVIMDGDVLGAAKLNLPADPSKLTATLTGLPADFAKNLKIIINSGALPINVHILEERTIGAELGSAFATAGLKAALGALGAVALFMIVCYGLLGLFINIALAANLALLTSIFGLVGLELSLAGFAGLVLTVGVCVDGLILICERVREDSRNGLALPQALESGFLRARNTIIDANITTLLGSSMLFLFGAGSISGFAMTVSLGICVSLFINLTFARLLLATWLHNFRPTGIPARLLRILPVSPTIPFMRLRTSCAGLALFILILTMGLYASAGLHYGIDFTGGSLAVLTPHAGQADIKNVAARAAELNIGQVSVRLAHDEKNLELTIPSQQMGEEAEQSVALKLRGEFDDDYRLERVDIVGEAISDLLSKISILAVFLSLLAIFLYVWWRFDWKFGLGALITTLHDIVALLLVFMLLQWEFSLWSMTALLAIIGYSLNDTIVVYDRIRSFLIYQRSVTMGELVDMGINHTLSRTILTSLATLLAHIPLYYYGGTDMRNFASVLLIGIVIGTISSIFIAGPLLVLLGLGQAGKVKNTQT